MTIAGKYTKLVIMHPEKTVDASWLDKNFDKILEELNFATNALDEIVRKHKINKKKK
jgi:hypothetical protein